MNKTTRRILTCLEQISEKEARKVLDFAEFLLSRRHEKLEPKSTPENDPILEYIGGVSHGALAKNIDSELYGGNS